MTVATARKALQKDDRGSGTELLDQAASIWSCGAASPAILPPRMMPWPLLRLNRATLVHVTAPAMCSRPESANAITQLSTCRLAPQLVLIGSSTQFEIERMLLTGQLDGGA